MNMTAFQREIKNTCDDLYQDGEDKDAEVSALDLIKVYLSIMSHTNPEYYEGNTQLFFEDLIEFYSNAEVIA